jgi:hypothetical protein
MSESKVIKAPRLILNKDNIVINLDTNKPAHGIAVFGSRSAPALPADESPITAMERWSEFRQSSKA